MSDLSAFKLPEIDPAARPEFTDGPSCRAWLENVPLANVSAAQHQLLVQVEEFNRAALASKNRFESLEAVREAVSFVQIEQAKRFTHRALPMLEAEAAVFEDTIEHEAWNEGDQPRYVLICDIWSPRLSPAERAAIAEVIAAADAFNGTVPAAHV